MSIDIELEECSKDHFKQSHRWCAGSWTEPEQGCTGENKDGASGTKLSMVPETQSQRLPQVCSSGFVLTRPKCYIPRTEPLCSSPTSWTLGILPCSHSCGLFCLWTCFLHCFSQKKTALSAQLGLPKTRDLETPRVPVVKGNRNLQTLANRLYTARAGGLEQHSAFSEGL